MPKKSPKPVFKPNININILYPQGTAQKLPVKFLKWLVSYGRFIAIFVEVVVVATFVLRFSLDNQLENLKGKINDQLPVIQSHQSDEAQIRQLQSKLEIISKTYSISPDWIAILKAISQELPSGVKLANISLDHSAPPATHIRITGQASSSNDLEILLTGLKQDKQVKDVNLASISLESGQISFSITGTY